MKRFGIVVCVVMSMLGVYAQPRFVADAEILKLGEVLFQSPKTVTFVFTNKGDSDLRITQVHPSCGCLTVRVPDGPIAPGAQSEIQVTFDAGMLGTFYRDVEIYTNASDEPVYLAMQGCVVTELNDFGQDFPIDLGNVRMSANYLEYEDVNKGDHPVLELKVANTEHTVYRPELMHLPPYLTATYLPESIPMGREGIIRLTLNSELLPMMGLNQTSVYLSRYLGDKIGESNEIQISAVLLPDFSGQDVNAGEGTPEMNLSATEVDFGSLGKAKKRTATIYLTNTGTAPLEIQQLQVFNKALTVSLGNKVIRPGKKVKLKVTVWAEYLKSMKSKPRVLLISNDPKYAKEIIQIRVQP